MPAKTYPAINALTLSECNEALNLADLNRASVRAEFLAEFDSRVKAIRERRRRLEFTQRRITELQNGGKYAR